HGAKSETRQSGQGGEFFFEALAPARWDFTAERQESAERGAVKDVDIEKVHDLTLRLESLPFATIVGRVSGLDPSWSMRFIMALGIDSEAQGTAVIDAAGNYRLEHAPTGTVEVSANAGTLSELGRQTKSVTAEVAPGSEVRVDLAFLQQVTVHGHVTRGGVPLEGATVQFD